MIRDDVHERTREQRRARDPHSSIANAGANSSDDTAATIVPAPKAINAASSGLGRL